MLRRHFPQFFPDRGTYHTTVPHDHTTPPSGPGPGARHRVPKSSSLSEHPARHLCLGPPPPVKPVSCGPRPVRARCRFSQDPVWPESDLADVRGRVARQVRQQEQVEKAEKAGQGGHFDSPKGRGGASAPRSRAWASSALCQITHKMRLTGAGGTGGTVGPAVPVLQSLQSHQHQLVAPVTVWEGIGPRTALPIDLDWIPTMLEPATSTAAAAAAAAAQSAKHHNHHHHPSPSSSSPPLYHHHRHHSHHHHPAS
eukprot:gene16315-biopygen23262